MIEDRRFHATRSSACHTFDAILGHISVSIEIYGSSWSCMFIPTYEIHVDTMFPPWSLSGVTQLGLHFAMPRCHHAFLSGDALLIYGSDSVVHVDDLDRAFDDGASPTVIYVWGIPPPSFTFRASPYRHLVWGIPPLSFTFGASPHRHLRLGHPPTVTYVWGIPPVIYGIPLPLVRLKHPSIFTLFKASSYLYFVQGIPLLLARLGHPPIGIPLLLARLGHPPIVPLFRASPYCRFRLGHPPTFESSSSLFSFGVQSHHHHFLSLTFGVIIITIFSWRSEPPSLFSFGVQSHHHHFLSLTFGVIIITIFSWRSEPPSLFSFGVQSHHHRFSVLAFRAITIFSFGVQSHHFSVLAFRAITIFSFGVQSHHRFSVLAFRAITIFGFGVQSHHRFSVLAFRAITIFSFGVQSHHRFSVWRSEPSSSHHYFRFWRSEPSSLLSFGVQSHHYFKFWRSEPSLFSVLAFRAIIASQFWRSEPSLFSVLAFRAIIASQFWRSEPSLFLVLAFRAIIAFQFGVQSHHRAITIFSFGDQSHHRFSVLAFRAITIFKPSSLLAFGIHSHHYFRFRLPEPSPSSCLGLRSHYCHLVWASRAITVILLRLPEPLSLVLRVGLVIQSHNSWRSGPLALHILPSGFCIRPRLSSLRYPVLIAYSSRTPGWFDRYSSLTLISWAADGRLARAEECGGWQEATAGLLGKTGTGEKQKKEEKEKEAEDRLDPHLGQMFDLGIESLRFSPSLHGRAWLRWTHTTLTTTAVLVPTRALYNQSFSSKVPWISLFIVFTIIKIGSASTRRAPKEEHWFDANPKHRRRTHCPHGERSRVRPGKRGELLDVDPRRHAARTRRAFDLARVVPDSGGVTVGGRAIQRELGPLSSACVGDMRMATVRKGSSVSVGRPCGRAENAARAAAGFIPA
ncbi:hypothetical protein CK203_088272 [Vitis vinifera]|uniref:Uncharacterized protein n=1 Tax=Vitis vinifera TaxID=29760 RepID=A0A438ELF5_VITVI|nr:hypothetical protein CK203_088272 [Vitis vinifera]